MESSTKILRRLLDERGVEYRWDNGTVIWYVDGVMYNAWGFDDERLTMSVCHLTPEQAIAATLGPCNDSCNCTNGERTDLAAENAMLREQMERLVTLLRNDCDIDASWDGLRRFWSIGLTEDGCLMRDRACKAEADNAKLRERVSELEELTDGERYIPQEWYALLQAENAALRELVRDMYEMAYPEYPSAFDATFADRMHELGLEASE